MQKKAQVLIIFIWILVVLVILVVSISHRAAMTFRFIQYQKDRQIALYLAKAGINRAIAELERDKNTYDNLNETWSTGIDSQTQQPIFGNIELVPASGGTFSVTITDEESKININQASKEILTALLEDFDINTPEEIAKNIRIWRGDVADDNEIYENLGYPAKGKSFTNTQELMLVKDITPQDYQELKEFITVYPTDDKININTVADNALNIFLRGITKELDNTGQSLGLAESIAGKVIDFRKSGNGYFQDINDIKNLLTSEESVLFNNFSNRFVLKSSNFSIEAVGRTGRIEGRITAIYNRNDNDKRILYWYED